MIRRLVVIDGPDKGKLHPLHDGETVLIGRSDAQSDWVLRDPHVSRVHCQVEVTSTNVVLTDANSSGGTCVNGRAITQHPLRPGDIIRIGSTQIRFEGEGEKPAARTGVGDAIRPQPLEDLPGNTLAGYEVGEILAKGNSGMVFRGRDVKENRDVALKVLWPELSRSEEEMQRFVRTMKTVLPLRHPNLITIFAAGRTGPYCWTAMELVEGDSLTRIIQRIGTGGMLEWQFALRVAIHLGLALEHAFQHHIIHRNITPQNVLIRRADQVAKLGDLILAKALEGNLAAQITRPGELLGDVSYLSPERTQGASDIDCRSDIYSLGALVYALLTGRPPFLGVSLPDTVMKIRTHVPAPPRNIQPRMPASFQTAVLRMLAKEPDDRFQSPAEMLLHLEHIARTEGVEVM